MLGLLRLFFLKINARLWERNFVFEIRDIKDKQFIMEFTHIFEELHGDLRHEFDSFMSALLGLLENTRFPDEEVTEQQNLFEK